MNEHTLWRGGPLALATLALNLFVGCGYYVVEAEDAPLRMEDVGLSAGWTRDFHSDGPLLAGTRVCHSGWTSNNGSVSSTELDDSCLTATLAGDLSGDPWTCFTVHGAGSISLSVDDNCPISLAGHEGSIRFRTRPLEELDASLEWVEADLAGWVMEESTTAGILVHDGRALDELVLGSSPGEPVRVIEGGVHTSFLQLLHPDEAEPVAWSHRDHPVDISGPGTVRAQAGNLVQYEVGEAGSSGDILIPTLDRVGGQWLSVPVSEAAVLDLVVIMDTGETQQGPFSIPYMVLALLQDAQGEPLWGAEVDWELYSDHPVLLHDEDLAEKGYAVPQLRFLDMDCLPPSAAPEPQWLRITANVGELRETVNLPWQPEPDSQPDAWVEPEHCQEAEPESSPEPERACGCASPPPGAGLGLLPLLLLGLLRRQKH